MSLLRRHRAVRDVPEGDVITKTEPEVDAESGVVSTVGETDQPTGENPTPEPETVAEPEGDAEEPGVVVTPDGVEHVGVLPASAAIPPADDDEPQPEARRRSRSAR